ncbi:DUF2062 domain-containing protein [Pontibacter silvestris]|uniref:DUF2062 domain-containing protein n=1 Tax=Pontibacter silvestris TaxID=2305183 RepID=A0ABW4WX44_9BACT|nr:DUF2062 domain-containing protein [Pontibacter silvestris]
MLNLLKQGMTPRKLAATLAVGSVVGVIPAIGVTTILSTAVATRFRLNIAATVLVSYLVQPLQIFLAIPFIKAGIFIFGLSELSFTLDEIIAMFKVDWLAALNKLWIANLTGIAAWGIMAVPTGGILYLIILPLFKQVLPTQKEVQI